MHRSRQVGTPVLLAVIIVLLVWSTALADHTGVTFSQTNNTAGGTAIQGVATGAADATHGAAGVVGRATAGTGIGVWGRAINDTGNTRGVLGESASTSGIGVSGRATATTGVTFGVYGSSNSTSGKGVYAEATAATGPTWGVHGRSYSSGGIGVFGWATAGSGTTYGIYGRSSSASGFGVYGKAIALSGATFGVYGESASTSGRGLSGLATAASGTTYGVYAISNSTSGRGVVGLATAGSGGTYGVLGQSNSTGGRGLYGVATANSGTTYGVYGVSYSPSGTGIYGVGVVGSLAAKFDGQVNVNGHLFVHGSHVADIAENLPVAGPAAPGDVVVISAGRTPGVTRASRPYDTRVAGIISAKPYLYLQVTGHRTATAPVAMVGVIKAKASAVDGAIRPGDLLTTSAVPGHLMRCSSPARCIGAIVAKALQPLAKGNGQILVLIWRQ